MRTKIYQINRERDTNHAKFMGYSDLGRVQGTFKIDPSIYDEVFDAEIDETDLEAVFSRFNTDGHPLFRGHSLSVSDVIYNGNGAFYVDSVGFKPIEFDRSLAQKPENLMKIVFVEPHKPPYIAEIEDTLEAKQKAVGGFIQPVYNDDGTVLICDDESKLKDGCVGNRHYSETGIIAGNFFVCGDDGENFIGLTDEQAEQYMERFAEPEDISPEEVEADTGFTFIAFDYE